MMHWSRPARAHSTSGDDVNTRNRFLLEAFFVYVLEPG